MFFVSIYAKFRFLKRTWKTFKCKIGFFCVVSFSYPVYTNLKKISRGAAFVFILYNKDKTLCPLEILVELACKIISA